MTSTLGTYDVSETYAFNYERGPVFANETPEGGLPGTPSPAAGGTALSLARGAREAAPSRPKSFLRLPVRSRIGIAAGLLLNSKWIGGYAERGFDILTYKTVRSGFRPCYPPPNWVFVEEDGAPDGPVYATDEPAGDPSEWSSAVCFGMPSMSPETWRADIPRAKAALSDGQILIVSVVATPAEHPDPAQVAQDFARCAAWAAEAGADVVEANYSCPNVCSAEGSIYTDAQFSGRITREIRAAIGHKPLLLKIGHYSRPDVMRDFLRSVAEVADGVTLVNAISRPVLYRDGQPVFGEPFRKAGVLGRAIHAPCVENVRQARSIIQTDSLRLAIAAVGGISKAQDAGDFFDAGADAVLMGSSPMYLPGLAAEIKSAHPDW